MLEPFVSKAFAASATSIQGIYPNNLGLKGVADTLTMLGTSYEKIYSIITAVAGTLAVCAILYGGIKYMLAGGDAKKASDAKNALAKAAIGIIIITTTYGIITLGKAVSSILNKTVSNSALPSALPTTTVDPDELEYNNYHLPSASDEPNTSNASNTSDSIILNDGQGPVLNPTPAPTPTPSSAVPFQQHSQPNQVDVFPDL